MRKNPRPHPERSPDSDVRSRDRCRGHQGRGWGLDYLSFKLYQVYGTLGRTSPGIFPLLTSSPSLATQKPIPLFSKFTNFGQKLAEARISQKPSYKQNLGRARSLGRHLVLDFRLLLQRGYPPPPPVEINDYIAL